MNIDFDRAQLRLKAREVIRLYDARGARVECVLGALWITQTGTTRITFSRRTTRSRSTGRVLALIHAQARRARSCSRSRRRARACHKKSDAQLVAAWRAVGRGFARQFGPSP